MKIARVQNVEGRFYGFTAKGEPIPGADGWKTRFHLVRMLQSQGWQVAR
jgi:hypothetical protein